MSKIVTVLHNASNQEVSAQLILEGNIRKFSFERMMDAHNKVEQNDATYSCPNCKQPLSIKISSTGNRFFSHHPNSQYCEWKSDDERPDIPEELTTSEGKLHRYYKAMIQLALSRTDGVSKISSEKRVYIGQSSEKYRYPDVQCCYNGVQVAFEVQISNLSPEVIVAREKDYESIGWRLVWLLPKDKRFITYSDIINNPDSFAFYCSINSDLVNQWEREKKISFFCPVWKPWLGGRKVHDDTEYHYFSLNDVIESIPEDDGYLQPSEMQFQKGSLKYLTEAGTVNLLKILTLPDNYLGGNQSAQDAALDNYFLTQLGFVKTLKDAFRVIGSIKAQKSLWEIGGGLERALIFKFYPHVQRDNFSISKRYENYVPVALGTALTYHPELLETDVMKALLHDFQTNESFLDVESPIDQITGRGSHLLLAMFPKFTEFWKNRFLRDYFRE
ncbi:MAG: DUF6035 family protein [Pseudomonadota bacterium]|nr:DUF6035 family protein [Pseudomonadota bacterium]